MDLNDDNSKNNPHLMIICFFILMIVLSLCLITSVSANSNSTGEVISSSNSDTNTISANRAVTKGDEKHYIKSDMTNDEIQNILNESKSGDTINFKDRNYYNISLVINKKLNIVSDSKSIIHTKNEIDNYGKSLGVNESFGFYFTENSSGSILKGFTFTGNAVNPIMINGGNNIGLYNNTIIGGSNGIYINNSKNSRINSNNITKTANNGILANNSESLTIKNNRGNRNYENGLMLYNIKNSYIGYNNFSNNELNGIELSGYTTNNKIIHNYLHKNINNIFINSISNKDIITQNTITGARLKGNSKYTIDNTGVGVLFGEGYYSDTKKTGVSILDNTVGFNDQFDAKNHITKPKFKLGDNYYINNDGQAANAHLCPMLFGGVKGWESAGFLRLRFKQVGGKSIGQIYDKNGNVREVGDFDAANVEVDGRTVKSASYKNGRMVIDSEGSRIRLLDENGKVIYEGAITKTSSNKGQSKNINKNDVNGGGTKVNQNSISSSNGGKNSGSGNGFGSLNGSGSNGQSISNSSGIASGTYNGNPNGGKGQSGENGKGGSAVSQGSESGAKSFEISAKKVGKLASDNRVNLAVLGIFAIMILFAIGYKRKNKDEEENDDDEY